MSDTTVTTTTTTMVAAANAESVARPPSSQPRKTTPFINFFESKHNETEAANPNAKFNDIKRILQIEFSKLSKEERAKYGDEIQSDQAEVTSIVSESEKVSESEYDAESTVTDGDSELESDPGSNIDDADKRTFVFIELVNKGVNVSDEVKDACLALIDENIRVVVLGGQPLSNELAESLCKDKAGSFGYQSRHDRATMQQKGISRLINAADDDSDSSDQEVGNFLGGVFDLVKEAFGAEIDNSFINLNHGENKTPKEVQSKGNVSWHTDNIQVKYDGRVFVHWTQYGEHGAVHLRPVGTDLEFRINIPPGCAVYMSREILGDVSGNPQFPMFEHKHFKDGACISWVFEVENVIIEMIESSMCSAIMTASLRQDAMHLDLSGIFGGDIWDASLYTGSASRDDLFKPRLCTVVTNKEGRLLLFCSRIQSLTNGAVRDGVALFDIIGIQRRLTVQALERCMHTGGFPVGELRVFLFKYFAPWGFTSGQLSALIDADPEAKEELANLLTENSNRNASLQVEITLFNNDGSVIGPSTYDTMSAGTQNRDRNKVTIPNLPRSMANDGSRRITNKMIHAGTIDSGGEGLWIPKSSGGRNPKPIGRLLIRFTGVTTTRRDILSGRSKRKHSETDSDSDSDSDSD